MAKQVKIVSDLEQRLSNFMSENAIEQIALVTKQPHEFIRKIIFDQTDNSDRTRDIRTMYYGFVKTISNTINEVNSVYGQHFNVTKDFYEKQIYAKNAQLKTIQDKMSERGVKITLEQNPGGSVIVDGKKFDDKGTEIHNNSQS